MSNTIHNANQIASEVVKITPPAAYLGAKFLGLSPAEWVTWLTLVYILFQLMIVIPKWYRLYGPWFVRRYIAASLLLRSISAKLFSR